jgi:hypothetical protein
MENSTAKQNDELLEEGKALSLVVIPLLKGVVDREEQSSLWPLLLRYQARVRDYVEVLGLELFLDEAEGYAFLRSLPEDEEHGGNSLPRLIPRRQLSFPVSLLLALLRKKLAEADAGGEETRLVLSREEIGEMLLLFLPGGTNETRLVDQVDTHINKVVQLGFLRKLRGQEKTFEVRRILKAFVDAQWLADFHARLKAYESYLGGEEESQDVES